MGKKFIISVWLVFFAVHFSAFGQFSAPKYSNAFLSIGVGARGLALGGSQSAVVSDVTAGYWNPAGLVDMPYANEAALMHAEYFAGIAKYDYGAFASKIDAHSTLGVSVIRFAIDDIPDTRFLYDANGAINYDNIRFFSAADYGFLFSYARKLPRLKNLKVGVNFKLIYRQAGNFAQAWGFGLDAGAQWQYRQFRVGLMVRDVTSTFNAWTHNSELLQEIYTQTGNTIPETSIEVTLPQALLGIAHETRFFEERFGLLSTLDLNVTFDGKRNTLLPSDIVSVDPGLGLEVDFLRKVFLRGGLHNIQQIKKFDESTYTTVQVDFGLGVQFHRFSIDYALTDMGNFSDALYSHVFSLKMGFEPKKFNKAKSAY